MSPLCGRSDLRPAVQMELPGGARVRAKIGLHCDEASDSLVGCSNTLHYRWDACHISCQHPLSSSLTT